MEQTLAFSGNDSSFSAGNGDLSGAVASGATAAELRFKNTSDFPIVLHLRKTGSSDDIAIEILPDRFSADIKLALTSARTIDYYVEGGGSISCYVVDYTAGSLESGSTNYSTAALVASLLRLIVGSTGARITFSASTDPTLAEVENFILEAEADIEKETNHAWRAVTVTNEYHNVSGLFTGEYRRDLPVKLKHRSVRSMTSGIDKIEYWDGSSWVDMVATLTEGRANDFWVNYTAGIIYFVSTKPYYEVEGIRVTYRYGESSVPKDIQEACTKLAALKIIEDDDYKMVVPEGTDKYAIASKAETWRRDIQRILGNRKELLLA